MAEMWDCIVVGLGGVGSAAASELARRGVRVLGLDQQGPAHDSGSSHGESRIIRKAYFEHPDYVPLLHRAFQGWQELERESGRRLFDPVGLFLCGPPEGEAIAGTLQAAREHALPLDVLTAAEASERFPGFRFHQDDCILFERVAGVLRVEDCVRAHLGRARAAGADLRFHEAVQEWRSTDGGVRVLTDRGIHRAAKLVVAAGAWSSRLLRRLGITLQVLRKTQLWFRSAGDDWPPFPGFFFEEAAGAFYGLPSVEPGQIKIAEHSGGVDVDDPAVVERRIGETDVEPVRRFIETRVPRASPQLVRHSVCLYTMSPDGHFLVDRHPDHPQVCFAAGLSGHGFKFSGVLGEALADLATLSETRLPIGFLGLGRLPGRLY